MREEDTWNRAILALAVKRIGELYHSGQWSKGYAKVCQADRILDQLGFRAGHGRPDQWEEVRGTAAAYLWKHRHKVARTW